MVNSEKERVCTLLSQHQQSDVALRCCEAMTASDSPLGTSSGPVARCEVLDIYTRRARLAGERRSAVGFDAVLQSLASTTEPWIDIHVFQADAATYIIFTDTKLLHLFGVLLLDSNPH